MKFLKFIMLSFFLISVLSACQKNEQNEFINLETNHDFESGYDAELETRQQWREGNWWSACEAASLVLFVDPCFLTPARAAALQGINDAVNAFNNAPGVGIGITLVFDANNPNIDISIECDDLKIDNQGANGCVNETGGDLITIDTNGPGGAGCPVNTCFHTNTVMHEMGHILGFGHTNDGNDGVTINGTVVNNNSVFVAGDCNSSICAFSAGDLLALQTQYPCECRPRTRITGPTFLCSIGQEATYCIPNQFTVDNWDVPNNMSLITSIGNCITVSLNSFGGSAPLRVSINENGCIYEYELNINTHSIPNFDIIYNAPICFGDVVRFSILPIPSHQNLRAIEWEVEYGGLNIMSSNDKFAVVEATFGTGPARICATVMNECGNEKEYCINVVIQRESDCTGDGEIPNPK